MKKAPAEARACNSEVEFRLVGIHLVPLVSVHVSNLLDLFDQLSFLAMLGEHEEEVKLWTPLKLDPGHAVIINEGFDDVVVLDLPHCGDLCLLHLLSGRSGDGLGADVTHRLLLLCGAHLRFGR